jgi:calreticulin
VLSHLPLSHTTMRSVALFAVLLLAGLALASATTFYKEEFDASWTSRWVQSEHKKADGTAGELKLASGSWYGDAEKDKGVQTSQDARFYAYTSKFTPFSSIGKDLVLQFSAKHTQKIDCGGAYIKLLPADVDQAKFNGDSQYYIMFGPDVCGTSTKKIHVIFNYNGKNLLIKKEITAPIDQLTHVFTLIVTADGSYEVLVDGERKEGGRLEDDFDFLPAKMIKDPSVSKPADWVDEPLMDDPEDVKPADWDNTPKEIPDPEAEKPSDWDDEADGEWEAPMIANPEYKGAWKAKRIANPAYKGKWTHPEIANPDYKEDANIGHYADVGAVGFELWQVKAGTIFDNILVTDSKEEAAAFRTETWGASKDAEKAMFDAEEKKRTEKEEEERKAAEEARKAAEKAAEDDEDDEDDDEHDEL